MSALAGIEAALARVRDQALGEFGWTHLELVASLAPDGHTVVLRGTVAARGLIARVRQACGPDVALDVAGIDVLATGRLVAVPASGLALYRRPDRVRDDELATELDPADGPVEWLATADGVALVRGRDGTVGWTRTALGDGVVAPASVVPTVLDLGAIAAAWPAWLGAPYRLGGTRRGGVDCSGLVQRLLGAAALRVPRHSADQIAIDPRAGVGDEPATIVAIWPGDGIPHDRAEAPCHVGLVVADRRVVHASRSRAAVVVEPLAEFIAHAGRVAHVPPGAVLALQRRAAGRHDLLAVYPA